MTKNTLKPCPFCGEDNCTAKPRYDTGHHRMFFLVCCSECLAKGPEAADEDQAIKKWNNRVETQEANNDQQ